MGRRSGKKRLPRRCVGGAPTSFGNLSGRGGPKRHIGGLPPPRSRDPSRYAETASNTTRTAGLPRKSWCTTTHIGKVFERNLGGARARARSGGQCQTVRRRVPTPSTMAWIWGEQVVGTKCEVRGSEPELADCAQPRRIAVGADERVLSCVSGATSAYRGFRDTTCSRRARPPPRRLSSRPDRAGRAGTCARRCPPRAATDSRRRCRSPSRPKSPDSPAGAVRNTAEARARRAARSRRGARCPSALREDPRRAERGPARHRRGASRRPRSSAPRSVSPSPRECRTKRRAPSASSSAATARLAVG